MNINIKNSEDYLKSVLENKTGFKTPENYFTGVENQFSIFLSEEKLPEKTAFKTPNTYFNNLENIILDTLTSTKKEVKVISLKKRILKIIPVAAVASILLFIGLNSFLFKNSKTLSFDSIPDVDVENWISDNLDLISNDLVYAYTATDFDESDMIPNSITEDEIEDYLNEENNISLILENN